MTSVYIIYERGLPYSGYFSREKTFPNWHNLLSRRKRLRQATYEQRPARNTSRWKLSWLFSWKFSPSNDTRCTVNSMPHWDVVDLCQRHPYIYWLLVQTTEVELRLEDCAWLNRCHVSFAPVRCGDFMYGIFAHWFSYSWTTWNKAWYHWCKFESVFLDTAQ